MIAVTAFLLVYSAMKVTCAEDGCQNVISCPCGDTRENVTVCADVDTNVCTRLSKCKKCEDRLAYCIECPENFEGVFCSQDTSKKCENPTPLSNVKTRFVHPIINVTQEMKFLPVDTVLEFSCDEGYRLLGSSSSICKTSPTNKNAWWSNLYQKPKCTLECGRGLFNYGPCSLMNCNKHAPWIVSISVENDDGVRHVCLGTLISHQTVLTAAHCLVNHKNFIIQFGKHGPRSEKLQVTVRTSSRIILHPDFSNATFDSDIGLLFFQPKIRFTADVQPVCLQDNYYVNSLSVVGGTGIVSVTQGSADALAKGQMYLQRMKILDDESCLEANKQADLFITKNSFCAGNKDSFQSVCTGDSGAPLFSYEKDADKFTLMGIASFSARHSCYTEGSYAVFTKVYNFLNWINANLK